MKKLKTSLWSRSAQLLGVAGQIASHEVAQKLKRQVNKAIDEHAPELVKTRIAQAKVLAENLSQLKGAAMKAGQLLSIDSSDILPPEAVEILSQLQSSAEPVEFSVLEKVLKADFPEEIRKELIIDPTPHSAASIGQVHRASFRGQDIALKIQYPGVRESIDSDLSLLKRIVSTFLTMSQKPIPLDDLFLELKEILQQETDYRRELELLQAYGAKIKSFGLENSYIVPRAIPEISSARILAMSFEEGVPLKKWLDSSPTTEQKQNIGRQVLDLYCHEFIDWGLVQTDPNYGNFLVRNNEQLVLLDFGATLAYDNEFIKNYRELLKAYASFDDEVIFQAAVDFQLLDPRESDEAKKNYADFMKISIEPFLPHKQPFVFNDADYTKRSVKVGRQFTRSLKYSPPPKKIIFLHRKLGGIFNLLRKMGVQMNLTPYWEKMVQAPLAEKSPWPQERI